MQQVQAEMRGDRRAEPAKTVGQTIADPRQPCQQHPGPARAGMHQTKQQRGQQQGEVVAVS